MAEAAILAMVTDDFRAAPHLLARLGEAEVRERLGFLPAVRQQLTSWAPRVG
jgi:hypothetical protein